jgi:hypothetical protein
MKVTTRVASAIIIGREQGSLEQGVHWCKASVFKTPSLVTCRI